MIEKIIAWSINNKFMVILTTLFVIAGGVVTMVNMPLDAIPDLSDVQVIIYTEYPGQAPRVVEDQVTYPLTTAMLSVPYAKVVRGYSFFGNQSGGIRKRLKNDFILLNFMIFFNEKYHKIKTHGIIPDTFRLL